MNLSFLPADTRYYEYFEQASANLKEITRALLQVLENPENTKEQVRQIVKLEHEGDVIVHGVTNLLPKTLITPFDLEEIQRLISAIDDAVDAVEETASRLVIYKINHSLPVAVRMANIILDMSDELDEAVRGLRDKRHFDHVREHIVQINTLEDNADQLFRQALSELVEKREDYFTFISWKEILELLEATTDRIEDAGDAIQRVVIANG